MKKIFLFLFFTYGFIATATDDNPIPWNYINDGIQKAIQEGNASALAAYFAPTIELSLPSKKGEVSKIQAEILMKDFFSTYPPVSFEVMSEGNATSNSYYVLGKYKSKTTTFSVYYIIEKRNETIELHILKFEPLS